MAKSSRENKTAMLHAQISHGVTPQPRRVAVTGIEHFQHQLQHTRKTSWMESMRLSIEIQRHNFVQYCWYQHHAKIIICFRRLTAFKRRIAVVCLTIGLLCKRWLRPTCFTAGERFESGLCKQNANKSWEFHPYSFTTHDFLAGLFGALVGLVFISFLISDWLKSSKQGSVREAQMGAHAFPQVGVLS